MQRSALKKKANNLNDTLAIEKIAFSILADKVTKTIFRNICHMVHLPITSANFANLSLLIKSQILTTKLCWWRTKRYSQTCSNDPLYKMTTRLRRPMLSPPKQIPIQLLLHKTTNQRPFFVSQMIKNRL